MSSADFSLTTFSPSGKLVQIEYALNAVQAGKTSLGIKATNGVVLASEKKVPSVLVDASTVEKTGMLSSNVGVTYSGMGPDFRVLLNKGRKAAQTYYLTYKDIIPVTLLARELATVMQEFTQSGGVRPFGVSLLVAGYDDEGPQLYQVSSIVQPLACHHSIITGTDGTIHTMQTLIIIPLVYSTALRCRALHSIPACSLNIRYTDRVVLFFCSLSLYHIECPRWIPVVVIGPGRPVPLGRTALQLKLS